MPVSFWIWSAAAFALSQFLAIIFAAGVAGALAASQKAACETPLFSFVRTNGLPGAAARFARAVATRDRRLLRGAWFRGWRRAQPLRTVPATVLLTTVVSLLAASFLPYRDFTIAGATPLDGLVAGAVINLVAFSYFWLAGLRYAATPSKERKSRRLPQMELLHLSQEAQDDLAVRIFWYFNVNRLYFVAIFFPWLYLVASWMGASHFPDPPSLWDSYLGPCLILVAFSCPLLTARWLNRRLVFEEVTIACCALLSTKKVIATVRWPLGQLSDPLEPRRAQIARLGVLLADAARELDGRQPDGARPHPTATLFRAASAHLFVFLRSQGSWSGTVPRGVLELPRLVTALIATPADPAAFEELSRRLSAFNSAATPESSDAHQHPGRIVAVARLANAGITGTATTLKAFGAIAVIGIVIALFILHRMSVDGLLQYLQ
jgi:hypothetical protein